MSMPGLNTLSSFSKGNEDKEAFSDDSSERVESLSMLNFKKSNHPSSGSTTLFSDSSPSLTPFETSDSLLEDFADKLALLDLILPGKEDTNFDFEAGLREIDFLLNQNPSTESNMKSIDPILEKFTNEPSLDYLPPPGDDDDDLFDLKSDND
nr:hypothetical protein [Tanacetum cinerariifolium]